jgi:hypothetical protein
VSAVAELKSAKQRKPMPREPLVVRCMVFQEPSGEYTAECIDLDIIASGTTPHDAFKSLIEAVSGYLSVAVKGDTTGLIPRPSPLGHRARYHLFALRAALNFGVKRNFLLSDWSPGKSCC